MFVPRSLHHGGKLLPLINTEMSKLKKKQRRTEKEEEDRKGATFKNNIHTGGAGWTRHDSTEKSKGLLSTK